MPGTPGARPQRVAWRPMAERSEAQHPPHTEDPHWAEAQRRTNRDALRALGADPYGHRTDGLVTIGEARSRFDEKADEAWKRIEEARKNAAKGGTGATGVPLPGPPPGGEGECDPRPVVGVAGRVVLKRDAGKLVWLQLRDHTSASAEEAAPGGSCAGAAADLQVAISQRDCAAPGFEVAKALDLGDIVVARGPLMRTRTGEVTVWASGLEMGAKSLAPPPEKRKGLADVELRSRRRYIDLWSNPESMRVFMLRSRLASVIRAYLAQRGFVEVETPTLQAQAGGAAARPFVTHLNALGIDLFMRVAPELYLKRLLVGGMPRVYEWSRNFRNEGMDRSHNPEFSMLEIYEAFGDYRTMMELTEGMFRACAREVVGPGAPLRVRSAGVEIDYGPPFAQVKYADLFERTLGFPMTDHARALKEAAKRGVATRGKKGEALDPALIVGALFDFAEEAIDPAKPTFVIDYPAPLCPLTRPRSDDPTIAERFELFVGGMEMANAYTELNDPDVQEQKFRQQLAGLDEEESTFRNLDEDFLFALKVGMPPAGGLGIGIDRLCMVMLNQRSIRDVVLFPLMRPEGHAEG